MCRNLRRSHSSPHNGRRLVFSLCAVLLFVFSNTPASAHKVTIFGWVEGDTVYTQSKFSGGKRAKSSTVVVYDKEGNQLLEGKTDEEGEFSFKVPKKTDLKVAIKASMGHLAEWTILAEEITAVADSTESPAPEVGKGAAFQEYVASEKARVNEGHAVVTTVGLSRQEVEQLIDASLDRKLAPIVSMLADPVDHGPTVSEIIGGIGYVFGLVGVALYFSNRRKRGS